ncbi:MAG: cytochrome c5 family protein [Lysobacterales bacterium]|nr:MAG: cytochrome c5 family protein [Xanthomonadales bacterium]
MLALFLFVLIVFFAASAIGANSFEMMKSSPTAVAERIKPFGQVRVGKSDEVVVAAAPTMPGAAPADAGAKSGEQVFNATCTVCHTAGVAGAPKVGDKAAWEPRLARGMDALVNSSVKGKGAMPPKGGNASLSDAEVKSAVQYMLEKSGLAPG